MGEILTYTHLNRGWREGRNTQAELLCLRKLREEQEWRRFLGADVAVKDLPEAFTPQSERILRGLGFELVYIPKLNLGGLKEVRRNGLDGFLDQAEKKYPGLINPNSQDPDANVVKSARATSINPSLSFGSKTAMATGGDLGVFEVRYEDNSGNFRANSVGMQREFSRKFWGYVNEGKIAFPDMPGKWVAFEMPGKNTKVDRSKRFGIKGADLAGSIDLHTNKVLDRAIIDRESADIRLPSAFELYLLGSRFGLFEPGAQEWTGTIFHEKQFRSTPNGIEEIRGVKDFRVAVGMSVQNNILTIEPVRDSGFSKNRGFRTMIVLR